MLHVLPPLHDSVFHRIRDLKHGPGGGGVVAAHDVFDGNIIVAPLFAPQDRPPDDGGVLELGEILRRVADLEEAGTTVEDCWRSASWQARERWS